MFRFSNDIFNGNLDSGVYSGYKNQMTSLEIIRKVMNVPMAAVVSIANTVGISVDDPESVCIDENALSAFADAYVRKMKYYFTNSLRSKDQLGPEELSTFTKFTRLYKKPTAKTACAESWKDIDQDALRDQFYAEIRKNTPKRETFFEALLESVYNALSAHSFVTRRAELHESITLQDEKSDLHQCIVNSRCYLQKQPKRKECKAKSNVTRTILLSARYHVNADDGKEDHNQGVMLSIHAQKEPLCNYTLKMVV